ncbi:MAG: B12-binding domain-containing radical SAM protein [Spirochaetales bacterium]|nr:B12-binding domain-containing radical SAM protein [Spirochaetales bacterium]
MTGQNFLVVLLTSPAGTGTRNAPYGAACVASALKRDGLADALVLEGTDSGDLARRALDLEPDLLGLSLYVWNRATLLDAAAVVRKARPGLTVVAGGPEASGDADGVLRSAAVDLVVVGAGEAALPDLVGRLRSGAGLPAQRTLGVPVTDLASLPSPWLDGTLDPARYGGAAMELTRGCPYRCAFCYESKGQKRVLPAPLERAAFELDAFKAAGVDEVFVLDPTFNARPERMKAALGLFRERGAGLRYFLELRAELVTPEQARLLSGVACSVQLGLQSADPEVLALSDRSGDMTAWSKGARMLERAGVTYGVDLIYGLPGDSLASFRKSLDWAVERGPNHLDLFRLSVLPGTALREHAENLGLEYQAVPPYAVRSTPTFPAADLDAAGTLSAAADELYNRGRAVMWFKAVSRLARRKPSAIFEAWAARFAPLPAASPHEAVEERQLAFFGNLLADLGRNDASAQAALHLIRASGAWTRALADGLPSSLDLDWNPEDLLDAAGAGIVDFARRWPRSPGTWTCQPGPDGPRFIRPRPRRKHAH